jgi:hypothetical protein
MKWYMAYHKKRTWILLLIPISLFILWITKSNTKIAEYVFAEGVYKLLSQGLNLITGLVPFSIMELEIVLFPLIAVVILIRFILKFICKIVKKQSDAGYMLAGGILNVACVLSIVLFVYVNLAGVNYYRYSISNFSGLNIQNASVDELYALCEDLASDAARIRTQLQELKGTEDTNGVLVVNQNGWREVSKTAKESFEKIAKEYPVLSGIYGLPKPVGFSRIMSKMEITGIFWPFTAEANVNVDGGEYAVPATMCHELAHLRGFMREDEANFIAYLVCRQSDSLEFQYSGTMLALTYAGNQLYKQDEELYKQIRNIYNEGMIADVREDYYYWKQFENTVISTVSNTVNDTYLKVNNQNDGVKSYGRMVDLLLADYRKNHSGQ